MTKAPEADLPATIQKIIENAPKHAEGRGVRLEVRGIAEAKTRTWRAFPSLALRGSAVPP